MKKEIVTKNVYDLAQERLRMILMNSIMCIFLFREERIAVYF